MARFFFFGEIVGSRPSFPPDKHCPDSMLDLPLREVIIEHEIAINLERSLSLLGKVTPLLDSFR